MGARSRVTDWTNGAARSLHQLGCAGRPVVTLVSPRSRWLLRSCHEQRVPGRRGVREVEQTSSKGTRVRPNPGQFAFLSRRGSSRGGNAEGQATITRVSGPGSAGGGHGTRSQASRDAADGLLPVLPTGRFDGARMKRPKPASTAKTGLLAMLDAEPLGLGDERGGERGCNRTTGPAHRPDDAETPPPGWPRRPAPGPRAAPGAASGGVRPRACTQPSAGRARNPARAPARPGRGRRARASRTISARGARIQPSRRPPHHAAGGADGDRVVGEAGEGRRHLLPVERERRVGLVIDLGTVRVRAGRRGRVALALLGATRRPVGFWKSGIR